MAISTTLVTKEAISYSVLTDKKGLVKLLNRNGVSLPSNPNDHQVTVAVLMASGRNKTFQKELATYLTDKVSGAHRDFKSFVADASEFGVDGRLPNKAFTGIDDFQFTGSKDFFNAEGDPSDINSSNYNPALDPNSDLYGYEAKTSSSSATPSGKTKVGGALAAIGDFIGKNILTKDNINSGINLGLQSLQNKTQANANKVQIEALLLQQQQAAMAKNLAGGGVNVTTSNTTKYVLIGAGVLLAIGIAVYFAKAKK